MTRNYSCHLTCSPETKKLIMEDCIREFIRHHPEFVDMRLTSGFILKKIAEFYLEAK